MQIAIVTPCFNEGRTVIALLNELESVLKTQPGEFRIVVVDDCSQDNTLQLLQQFSFANSSNLSLHVISLKFNLGHQGAIYQGLLYADTLPVTNVIVMDSDGEDDPAAIPTILQQKEADIVKVKRGKRKESLQFRIFYIFYKLLFRSITGQVLDFGNFSMISKIVLERVQYTSFIHYPAFLLKQKATKTSIVWDRNKRLDGKSKMSFTGLFFHAFKSLIEFAEELLMLFVKIFIVILFVLLIVVGDILYQKFIAHTAVLGWSSTLAIGLLNLAMICFGFFILGVMMLNLIHQQNRKTYKEIYTVIK